MSELLIMISSVLVAEMGNNSIHITLPIESKTTEGNKIVKTPVLLDTRAGGISPMPRNTISKSTNSILLSSPAMLMEPLTKLEKLCITPGSE